MPFRLQPASVRKERLAYLRYRLKIASDTIVFINLLKKEVALSYKKSLSRRHNHVSVDKASSSVRSVEVDLIGNLFRKIKIIWHCIMSFWLWFNLVTSGFILLWPELSSKEEHLYLYYTLWLNELFWLLDMVRKFFDKPKKSRTEDIYENAILYIKTTLILDVASSLPQLSSAINPQFVWFKIIRIYQIWLLHYPLEQIVQSCYAKKD